MPYVPEVNATRLFVHPVAHEPHYRWGVAFRSAELHFDDLPVIPSDRGRAVDLSLIAHMVEDRMFDGGRLALRCGITPLEAQARVSNLLERRNATELYAEASRHGYILPSYRTVDELQPGQTLAIIRPIKPDSHALRPLPASAREVLAQRARHTFTDIADMTAKGYDSAKAKVRSQRIQRGRNTAGSITLACMLGEINVPSLHQAYRPIDKVQARIGILAALGWTNRQIGDHLHDTADAAKYQLKRLFAEHDLTHREQLGPYFMSNGWLRIVGQP